MQDHTNIFVGLGVRLKGERQRMGLNQADFGALGGATSQTQMRYETGQQTPKLDYLYALSRYGVDPGYVVTGVRTEGAHLQDDLEIEIIGAWRNLMPDDRDTVTLLLRHYAARDADRAWASGDDKSLASSGTLHTPVRSYGVKDEN